MKWGSHTKGRPYSEQEVRHILDAYDKDGDGKISLGEWIEYHQATHAGAIATLINAVLTRSNPVSTRIRADSCRFNAVLMPF